MSAKPRERARRLAMALGMLSVLVLVPTQAIHGTIVFDPATRDLDAEPGARFTTNFILRNERATEETIQLNHSSPPREWAVNVTPASLTLGSGESGAVTVEVGVPAGEAVGAEHSLQVQAQSAGVEPTSANATIRVRIVEASPSASSAATTSPDAENATTALQDETGVNRTAEKPGWGGFVDVGVPDPSVVLGGASAATALALWVAVDQPLRFRILGGAAALFARLGRERLLDHEMRSRIHASILQEPGISYGALRRTLELNHGSLSHHLWVLQRERFIVAARDGVRARFFPPGARIAPGAPLSEAQRLILARIRDVPGTTQKDLAAAMSMSKQLVNYHVRALNESGKIRRVRAGRNARLYANDSAT